MKTKEELNALKMEMENLKNKLATLDEEELKQVTSGIAPGRIYWKYNRNSKVDQDEPSDEM